MSVLELQEVGDFFILCISQSPDLRNAYHSFAFFFFVVANMVQAKTYLNHGHLT